MDFWRCLNWRSRVEGLRRAAISTFSNDGCHSLSQPAGKLSGGGGISSHSPSVLQTGERLAGQCKPQASLKFVASAAGYLAWWECSFVENHSAPSAESLANRSQAPACPKGEAAEFRLAQPNYLAVQVL